MLKDLAKILKEVAKHHYPVRFGGDEFAVILSKAPEEKLERYANKILDAVHAKLDEVSLFMRAEKALYESNYPGKDWYCFEEVVE